MFDLKEVPYLSSQFISFFPSLLGIFMPSFENLYLPQDIILNK
jgi:hypothetical protein